MKTKPFLNDNSKLLAVQRLDSLRTPVADVLAQAGRLQEAAVIRACSHPLADSGRLASYCQHRACPSCNYWRDVRNLRTWERCCENQRVQTVQTPRRKLRYYHLTLKITDCATNCIGEACDFLTSKWNKASRGLEHLAGWLRKTEIKASGRDSTLENVHLHIGLVMEPTFYGRHLMSLEIFTEWWSDRWQRAAGMRAREPHLVAKANPAEMLNYLGKLDIDKRCDDLETDLQDSARFMVRLKQTQGVHISSAGGGLKPSDFIEDFFDTPAPHDWSGLDELMQGRTYCQRRAFLRSRRHTPIPIASK